MTDINAAAPSSQPFWFLGGRARILVPGEQTHGAMSVVEFADPRDHATPLHIHEAEDEVWIVLDGEISFYVGDDRIDLQAGQVTHGPRGVPHAYRVRSPESLMAVTFAPAGIEKWFQQNSSPVLNLDDARRRSISEPSWRRPSPSGCGWPARPRRTDHGRGPVQYGSVPANRVSRVCSE